MSYIQLPYGLVRNEKQLEFNFTANYEECQYIKRLPYIHEKGPKYSSSILNIIKNRDDLKKWLLATGDYGQELQEDLDAIVGYDEKFNNAIVRHALDTKNAGIIQNPNPLNLTFREVKKFDLQNPIIGKLATHFKASKLTDEQLTKKILMQGKINNIENRLKRLKHPIKINNNDSDDETGGASDGGGGDGDDGLPPTPCRSKNKEIDYYVLLMHRYRQRRYEPPSPTAEEKQEMLNWVLKRADRNRELESLKAKGLVKSTKSNAGPFKPVLPDTLPPTPFRNEQWPPPPVEPADDNFIKTEISDIKNPLIDEFSRL